MDEAALDRAAAAIREADGLLIGAGAGIGVDSGLPDFRGDAGFWNAYPAYRHLGVSFMDMANPRWFHEDPAFAWGFYGHRRNLYRETTPHAGFELLLRWGRARPRGHFVFTSNVDGQFQKAGFAEERLVECHGAIGYDQCLAECGRGIYPAPALPLTVDPDTFRAAEPLPSCPDCGALARPNILMFGDGGWDGRREAEQAARMRDWMQALGDGRLAIVEVGAGTAVPSVRYVCERAARRDGATLIRINPREPQVPTGQISLAAGALEALRAVAERV